MPIIDAHVHLYPPEVERDPSGWAEGRGERHWATLCTRRRRDGRLVQSLPTVDQTLAAMDAAGVERAVLLGWYWETFETCVWQNHFYADCVREHPDRLAACATFHPQPGEKAVLAELVRAREDGLVGLGELSPHSQGFGIDDPTFRGALAWAQDAGWPVNIHVTDPDSRPFPGRIETPLRDFVALAADFPRLPLVLAHWGGLLPLREPAIRGRRNVYYDTAASPLLYDSTVWGRFFAAVPASQILFGSDFPLNLYPRTSVSAEMAQFAREAEAAGAPASLLHENAAALFFRDAQSPVDRGV